VILQVPVHVTIFPVDHVEIILLIRLLFTLLEGEISLIFLPAVIIFNWVIENLMVV